jgi:beta-hydroxylase
MNTTQYGKPSARSNLLLLDKLKQPWFRGKNTLGVKKFYDADTVPITCDLESNFKDIRKEYDRIIKRYDSLALFQDISPHQTYISNDDKWRMFFLKGAAIWFRKNCKLMPVTSSILRRHPYVISAYVSVLGPRKKLNPHSGPYSGVLRLHLALDIPHPHRCYMMVGGKRGYWREGRCLFFDDTYEHWAVNNTDDIRAVLFMDVLKPLPRPLNWLNYFIVYTSRVFPYVFIPWFRHKRWEKKFFI